MIPKKIHYCWFGENPLPEIARKCIASWKKYCPDYEIVEWNESNFDLDCCDYVSEAYEARKWAFVSDVARLYALVNYGGIYMDTDVELIRPIDDLLNCDALLGFETEDRVSSGLMACVKKHPFFAELLHDYNDAHFIKDDGSSDITPNVMRITDMCLKYGFRLDNTMQSINEFTLLPCEYLCPKNIITRKITITENTYAIHYFDGSWLSETDKLVNDLTYEYSKILPRKLAGFIAKFVGISKKEGLGAAVRETKRWIKRKNMQ